MTTKGTDNRFRSLTVVGESGTPATPGSGDFKLYVADDGTFYVMDDTGTPTALGGGGFSDPMTTRGDIIVRNASNVTARLGRGSAGQVLTSDGTDIAWQTPSSSGGSDVFIAKFDASSSATIDFTGFINSGYSSYRVDVIGAIPDTNADHLQMRVGTGGGPTYDTGSNYNWNRSGFVAGGAGTNGATTTFIQLKYSLSSSNNAVTNGSVTMRPVASQYTGFESYFIGYDTADSAVAGVTGAHYYLTTTAVTALRFFMSSGNIASGRFILYGIKNS